MADLTDSQGNKNVIEQVVGFRKIEVKDRRLLLNGTPVKFHGVSRLDEHPLFGRALTPEIDRLDMEMIKDASFNMIRATIAPPHPASLDYSDELGFTRKMKARPARAPMPTIPLRRRLPGRDVRVSRTRPQSPLRGRLVDLQRERLCPASFR